jgi:hypothetical protein
MNLKNISDNIKWGYQRLTRKWDDRVIWSIDFYLSEMIPIWIKELKDKKHGIPCVCFDESDWNNEKNDYKDGAEIKAQTKWDEILDKIIEGFEAQKKIEDEGLWEKDPEFNELNKKFNEGFDLLKEYYTDLWD